MPVSPIDVATQGLLNSPLSVAAVRGRLTIFTTGVTPPGGGGKAGGLQHPRYYTVTPEKLRALELQLERQEEDEILAILVAIMEVIQ